MTYETLKSFFESTYPGKEEIYKKLISPIFSKAKDFTASDRDYSKEVDKSKIKSCSIFAQCKGAFPITFAEVELNEGISIKNNRVAIQNCVRRILENNTNAIIFFYQSNSTEWRVSYIHRGSSNKDSTNAKRYTYLCGPEYACRTIAERFKTLCEISVIKDDVLLEAFNVSPLSDEFFEGYREIYAELVEYISGKKFVKKGGKFVEATTKTASPVFTEAFEGDDKAVRDYVKKMMGRLVFLYFLQKKGWLGVPEDDRWGSGDKNFIYNLFKNAGEDIKNDFLEKALEPLFFSTLNTDRGTEAFAPEVLCNIYGKKIRIPYLNGGLFEEDELDKKKVKFKKEHFETLLEFFNQYNFTIDETDPDDQEIGVDPEMLGKIFENLLEDNKDKGAFYTPKEIVQYMCRESLSAYLIDAVAEEKGAVVEKKVAVVEPVETTTDDSKLRNFVEHHDVSQFSENEKSALLRALKDVKICDPAVGSGAFPMGMMNELYVCRVALEERVMSEKGNVVVDPVENNTSANGHFDNRLLSKVETLNDRAAKIKKEIVKNNIYGVDIEKGAVDIARLRFWLAIIVDEDEPLPLPNLDYKIMQGNSLLESFEGIDLSKITEKDKNELFDDADDVKTLVTSLRTYFDTNDHADKEAHREAIKSAVLDLLEKRGYSTEGNLRNNLSKLDLHENNQFFLWHTWFNDVFNRPQKEGFDIVIGNPPYIDSETMTNQGLEWERKILQKQFKNLSGNWDIYMAFFELALSLGRIVTFITPDKWLSKSFGEKFRKNQMCKRLLLITRAGSKVFDTATVDAIITLFIQSSNILQTAKFLDKKNVEKIYSTDISNLEKPYLIDSFFSVNAKIVERIDSYQKHLINLAECENACATSDFYIVKNLIKEDSNPNLSKYYKLINTGTIEKYRNKWADKEISYGGKYSFPVVSKKKFNEALGKSYIKRTSRPKIIFKGLNLLDGCLDENAEIIPGKSTIVICSEDISLLKFLLGVLNSKLPIFYIKTKYASSSYCGGITFSKDMLNNLPIPVATPAQQQEIITLVDKILAAKKASAGSATNDSDSKVDTIALEHKIDELVYKLYSLTEEEIAIVEK